jgi:hypothetical protein
VGLLGAFLILPAIAQAVFITSGGWIWQGRYSLPLLVILLVGAAAVLSDAFEALEPRTIRLLAGTIAIGWAAGQTYAFAATIHRYAVGASGDWLAMIVDAAWAPPLGIVPSILLFAIAASAVGWLGFRMTASRSPRLNDDRVASAPLD